VVIDDAVFDQVFAELVQSNNEGTIVAGPSGRGIALTEDNVDRLVSSEPMAPSGAACLELAWRHRQLLLGDWRRAETAKPRDGATRYNFPYSPLNRRFAPFVGLGASVKRSSRAATRSVT
jgi:hypothetical protein